MREEDEDSPLLGVVGAGFFLSSEWVRCGAGIGGLSARRSLIRSALLLCRYLLFKKNLIGPKT
jgi:hypothetical protein